MTEEHVTITADEKPELVELLRRLPAILAGNAPDVHGIAAGFKARLGYALLSLIAPNFNELGRGMPGVDGTKWAPLSPAYLAYKRRFGPGEQKKLKEQHGLGRGHRFSPGGKQGLLNSAQLKEWNKIYAFHLKALAFRMPFEQAKQAASGIAWNKMKAQGAKTKLEVYGSRTVQILVDTGRLRDSIQPGILFEQGPEANYQSPAGGQDQLFDVDTPGKLIVGSNDKKASWHHNAKPPRKRRRLWPETFPSDWWRQILGTAISGLQRIGDIFK
jgi:hypothetical protein